MATPTPPDVPEPVNPPAVPPAVNAPPQPVGEDTAIRDLVQEIVKQTSLGFDPATIRKGTITALVNGTPPTLTLNVSGDTTVTVSGVRWLDSYSPVVGDTVLLMKQGADVLAIGRIAANTTATANWTQATLSSGFSHNGDSQGNVEYRKVWDYGTWKMQWRGAVARSANNTIVSGLAADLRPASKRNLVVARNEDNGQNSCHLEFTTGGSVVLEAETQNISVDSHGHSLTITSLGSHSHGGTVPASLDHFHNDSFVSSNTSTATIAAPTWVSFNGVEYFL